MYPARMSTTEGIRLPKDLESLKHERLHNERCEGDSSY